MYIDTQVSSKVVAKISLRRSYTIRIETQKLYKSRKLSKNSVYTLAMSANGAVAPSVERLEALAGSYGRQSCLYPGCSAMVPLQFYNLHLNYCRRKWRGSLVTCPFNSTHRYGQPEDVFHRHICPDKAFAEAKSKFKLFSN